ncbi:hypothetical protein FXF51_56785 [Nonomuraea sp. PA05]|uniref:hypothetical protein n=1 Tax=Nonomuraea sp. PA05 TaxID=2604466 RepID=UPI0011DC0E5E|nr:hypothetical protein [Nonomuraea sp. PA05]TYB50239.1 hypothetical protein FXF51_56785 [Nonomuraea sp. PA05]
MAYATVDDLVPAYLATAPANASLLLARASRDVDQALLTAVYPVDDAGMPTEPAHVTALMEATCEQVAAWAAAGEDGTGATTVWDDVQIGSVRLARRGAQAGGGQTGSAARPLAPQAWSVLQQAGLTGHEPYTYIPCTEAADG